jgi:GNAT superfamily N-acetyltransferase
MGGHEVGAAALQPLAFPPPFSPDLHWRPAHLRAHVRIFPEGQFVAIADGQVVGACSNCIVSEEGWQAHGSWLATVGGPYLENHQAGGSTLYGIDITVHAQYRRLGIGRAFYAKRYEFVKSHGLTRYGTACRIPDYRASGFPSTESYARAVVAGERFDRTLSPLLRYGLSFIEVLHDYMDDPESDDSAALLEWLP